MKALLDTNALIFAGSARSKLGRNALQAIVNRDNTLLVSAASAWEIATKVRIGKLPEAIAIESNFVEDVVAAGYYLHPISPRDALRAGRFNVDHKDPFDRIIAAQALALDIPVISNDAALDSFGVRRIW